MGVLGSNSEGKSFPPGFRFHPSDEELVLFYLKRKMLGKRFGLDVIAEAHVYKCDPEELPGLSKLKTGDRQWFFFCPRDRKYPNATRSNRATIHGYWKATGKDRVITCHSRSVGNKKTLVFYRGRAPSGVRTNWVMHEYTLHEEELKKCSTPLDYYALYKVYKKSGVGPKNGEHYGAVFREEDWEENNCEVQCVPENEDIVDKTLPIDDSMTVHPQKQSWVEELELIMDQLAEEALPVQPVSIDNGSTLDQFSGWEVAQNILMEDCLGDVYLPHSHMAPVQASFNNQESDLTELQIYGAPEVASCSNINQTRDSGKIFLEDFLEMDDLLRPEPLISQTFDASWSSLENLLRDDFTNFDPDQSTPISVPELWSKEFSEISPQLENRIMKTTSHTNEYVTENHVKQLLLKKSNSISPQMLTDEPKFCDLTNISGKLGSVPPLTTGVVQNQITDHNNSYLETNGSNNQDDSWFSSALWSFVESIPTTPASASDSALVNRAFERMSSFGRLRLNATNVNFASTNPSSTPRKIGKSSYRLLCFSVFGILCAVLWVVLIGTSVRVMS